MAASPALLLLPSSKNAVSALFLFAGGQGMNIWLGLGKEKSFFVLKGLIKDWQGTWCPDPWEAAQRADKQTWC